MRIRTFIADSIAEAMAQVRDELGPDAIIIATKEGKRGQRCEVRAAIDEQTEPLGGSIFDLDDKLRSQLFAEMENELRELKQLRDEMRKPDPKDHQHTDADVVRVLKYHRFAPTAAKPIFNAARDAKKSRLEDALGAALFSTLPVTPLPLLPSKPIMLVGPSGVGKTVATAKLVARALAKGTTVNCLTTDTLKAGAVEQLGHFCELMGQTLMPCETPIEVVRNMGPGATLIDSPGVNPYRPAELRDLEEFIKAANAEPVLVLAAGHDAEELTDVARAFAKLGARRVIMTKLDAAQRLGSIFSAAFSAGLSIAHTGLSPYVADGFRPLTHSELGNLLADIPGPAEFSVPKERAAS